MSKKKSDDIFYGLLLNEDQEKFKEALMDDDIQVVLCDATAGCFTGDTLVRINARKRGKCQTIESLYRSWNGLNANPQQNIQFKDDIYIRGLRGDRVRLNRVLDVICKGPMKIIKLTFEDGRTLRCTPDHKIYEMNERRWIPAAKFLNKTAGVDLYKTTTSGNKSIKHIDKCFWVPKGLHPYARKKCSNSNREYIEIHRAIYEADINGYDSLEDWRNDLGRKEMIFVNTDTHLVHHIDFNHYNNDAENLVMMSKELHNKIHGNYDHFGQGTISPCKCISIESCGEELVYDICCESYHSYTANDIVVHNSGKTLLSVACAKIKVLKEQKYDSAVWVFPVVEEATLGYRPGDTNTKLADYLEPLHDALTTVGDLPSKVISSDVTMKNGTAWIDARSATFMRGINLKRKFIIIDECQNLTVPIIKRIVSRAHSDSKVVILGCQAQTDIPIRDSGFKQLIEHMEHYDGTYKKCELPISYRGKLAMYIDKL